MMSSLMSERLRPAPGSRAARALDRARQRAGDGLAGRTVWSVAGLPDHEDSSGRMIAHLAWAEDHGVSAARLEVRGDEPLSTLGEILQAMLSRRAGGSAALGAAERAIFFDGTRGGDAMVGRDVAPDDIVVLQDALAAVTAQAARERGAHVVWWLDVGDASAGPAGAAWTFLRPFTRAVDAYLAAWPERTQRSTAFAAALPCSGTVTAMDVDSASEELGWGSMLAGVVGADRTDTVGGTLHVRPTVAAR
jgi:hypothetical protein